jgi:hypothetical protein
MDARSRVRRQIREIVFQTLRVISVVQLDPDMFLFRVYKRNYPW